MLIITCSITSVYQSFFDVNSNMANLIAGLMWQGEVQVKLLVVLRTNPLHNLEEI